MVTAYICGLAWQRSLACQPLPLDEIVRHRAKFASLEARKTKVRALLLVMSWNKGLCPCQSHKKNGSQSGRERERSSAALNCTALHARAVDLHFVSVLTLSGSSPSLGELGSVGAPRRPPPRDAANRRPSTK